MKTNPEKTLTARLAEATDLDTRLALTEALWYWQERAVDLAGYDEEDGDEEALSEALGLLSNHLYDTGMFLKIIRTEQEEGDDDDPALVSARQMFSNGAGGAAAGALLNMAEEFSPLD